MFAAAEFQREYWRRLPCTSHDSCASLVLFKVPRALLRSWGPLGHLPCTPTSVNLLALSAIYVESNLRLLVLGDDGTHSYCSILARL